MRVLVTGGTGYLGVAIVRALVRRGHDPVVFARGARPQPPGTPGTFVTGDVRDRTAVLAAARGVDAICHTAALVSTWQRDPADFDRTNVGGLETVIDVCHTLKIPRLVYTSSFLALPPHGRSRAIEANDYQRSKVRAREIARAAASRGVPIVTLVPGVIFGPGPETEANLVGRLIRDHRAGLLPGIIGAPRIWSFAFVDDVADAHASALERAWATGEYSLGGENSPQLRLFELMRDHGGTPLPRRIPYLLAWLSGLMDERAAGRRRPRLTRGAVKILELDWPLDSTRSIEELGYRITPLATGIQPLLASGS